MSWDLPSPRVRELIRQGAELTLHPPEEWLAELDEATLTGPHLWQVAGDPALAAATRRTNRSNLLHWATSNLRAPGERVPANVGDAPLAIARDLVRRGFNESALDAYRAGQAVALRLWIEICFSLTSDPGELRELLDVSCRSISAFVDDTLVAISAQIARERDELTRGTHAEQRETVRLLLDGAPISRTRAEQRLGYRLTGQHTAAIVWSDDADADLGALDRVADLIAARAGDSRPLTVLASAATRWVWVHGQPDTAGVRATIDDVPAVRVALGSTAAGMDGFRRSYLDALTVQRMLARLASPRQLATHDEVELVALLTADPEGAENFMRRTLGSLSGAGSEITESLRTYIVSGCNASRAAAGLYTHRNTLLRRLARADELLPRPLAENVLNVGVALEVLRWYGPATPVIRPAGKRVELRRHDRYPLVEPSPRSDAELNAPLTRGFSSAVPYITWLLGCRHPSSVDMHHVVGGVMEPDRWFGVGSADGVTERATARAVDDALIHDDPKLLIVFCSQAHDLRVLVRHIRERARDVPLIGCTTAGEIATAGPNDASVVVTALGGDGFDVRTAVATEASRNLREAGAHVARCLPDQANLPHRVLLLLSDGLAGDQQEIVRGAHGVLGAATPLVGGCAGDDLKMTQTFQLCDDRVLTDSVVAAGIASDAPLGIGVRHGWRRVGEPMLVTSSTGHRVYTLDDRPALDAYLSHLGVTQPAHPDQEGLARLALTHPLGLSRPSGEDQVRFIGGGDFAERSLSCIAEVPQGALVWIMEGDARSVLEATDAACSDSLSTLGGSPPLGMLAFDCIARRGVLGEIGIRAEIDRIAALASGAPVAGFYTYGEIARTRGVRGFHNQTLVVLSIA